MIAAAVQAVADPEMSGVAIGELGLVVEVTVTDGHAAVTLRPTFLGCPALAIIEADVRAAAMAAGAATVDVTWTMLDPWTPAAITEVGLRQLADLGIGLAGRPCPVCGSVHVEQRSPVGPTACRSLAWCSSCRTPVELVGRR